MHFFWFFFFSFPIWQTEDIQKLQLIPLQRPLITPNHLHKKLVQPETETPNDIQPLLQPQLQSQENRNDHNASVIEIDNDSSCASKNQSDPSKADNKASKYLKKDIKTSKRLEKKRLKQLQKQQLKLEKISKKNKNNEKYNDNDNCKKETTTNDNNRLQSNLKKRSSRFNHEPTVPSVKTKSTVNVKFAFDTIDNSNETNNPEPVDQLTHLTCTDIVAIENSNANNGFVQITNNNNSNNGNNGEYDTLPLIKVEKSTDDTDGMVDINVDVIGIRDGRDVRDGNGNILIPNTALPISCSSTDSIPFMDDSPNFRRATSVPIETHKNLHDSRFITLQPRNIGAQSVVYARKLEKPLPITINIPPKRDQFDKSAQILYQSLKESIDHHFERSSLITSKLCQVCHEFMLVPEAVKCLTCGLVCHHSCTISQVCFNLFSIFVKLFQIFHSTIDESKLNGDLNPG